jgi:hypothetical protein
VKESRPFFADFDIWLDPKKGGAYVKKVKRMQVRLLIYYSMDEFNQLVRSKSRGLDVSVIRSAHCMEGTRAVDQLNNIFLHPLPGLSNTLSPTFSQNEIAVINQGIGFSRMQLRPRI